MSRLHLLGLAEEPEDSTPFEHSDEKLRASVRLALNNVNNPKATEEVRLLSHGLLTYMSLAPAAKPRLPEDLRNEWIAVLGDHFNASELSRHAGCVPGGSGVRLLVPECGPHQSELSVTTVAEIVVDYWYQHNLFLEFFSVWREARPRRLGAIAEFQRWFFARYQPPPQSDPK